VSRSGQFRYYKLTNAEKGDVPTHCSMTNKKSLNDMLLRGEQDKQSIGRDVTNKYRYNWQYVNWCAYEESWANGY